MSLLIFVIDCNKRHILAIIPKEHFGSLFHHANDIINDSFYFRTKEEHCWLEGMYARLTIPEWAFGIPNGICGLHGHMFLQAVLLFRTVAFKHGIINNQYICAVSRIASYYWIFKVHRHLFKCEVWVNNKCVFKAELSTARKSRKENSVTGDKLQLNQKEKQFLVAGYVRRANEQGENPSSIETQKEMIGHVIDQNTKSEARACKI